MIKSSTWRPLLKRRAMLLAMSAAAALLLVATATPALCTEYDLGRAPGWVKPARFTADAPVPTGNLSNGVYYLLCDFQTRVNHKGKLERYEHFAIKVANSSGTREASQVFVSFDPEYEHVTLHSIRVHRARTFSEQLKDEKIKVLQRESQLEYQIYDGTKSINVILDDVRIGDIVEYSYTITGRNPVFADHFFSRIDAGWSVPVHRVRNRLVWPGERKLLIKNHGTGLKPKVSNDSGYREYLWSLDNAPPLFADDGTPEWYDPYPWVQLSDMAAWQDVVRWAESLYRTPKQISPDLDALIAKIKASYPDDAGRVSAVLRFTQDEVRYMGIEIGPKSHAPSDPSVVFERRFGDCKEKVLLAVTMLRRLGIKADPALVNSRNGKLLDAQLPSPTLFNHVILKVHADGRAYWLDPTITLQRGSLDKIHQPNYGWALVLAKKTTALEQMPVPDNRATTKLVQDTFDLRKGVGQEAAYTVKTVYTARSADYMRRLFANNSTQELQKKYLNFYADKYPSIQPDQEMVIEDDETLNRLTVTETYRIPELWETLEDSPKLRAYFIPQDLNSYLVEPESIIRSMPLGIGHPINIRQKTTLLLPEEWDAETGHEQIEDPAFLFTSDILLSGKTLTLDYHYQSRKDSVAAADIETFKRHINKASDTAWYSFTAPDPSAVVAQTDAPAAQGNGLNWTIIATALLALALSVVLAAKLYAYDPEPTAHSALHSPLQVQGIGGWLLLVAFGMLVQPFPAIGNLYNLKRFFLLEQWVPLTTPGTESYHVMWAPVILFELVDNVATLVVAVLLLVLFFKKRSSFPRLYIIFRIAAFLFIIVDVVAASWIPIEATQPTLNDYATLSRDAFFGLIWIVYFLKSERVRATFIQRRQPGKSQRPVLQVQPPAPAAPAVLAVPAAAERLCPQCASSIIRKRATKGPHQGKAFYVCVDYPKCRHVELIES